jgi:tetratricopeptide (TPR) repeat protein
MTRFNWLLAGFFVVVGLVSWLAIAPSALLADETPDEPAAEEPLPLYSEMKTPTMQQLLTEDPLDWVILKLNPKEGVMVTQPIYPRPNTLGKKEKELADLLSSSRRPKQKENETKEEFKERIKMLIAEARVIRVSLPEDPEGADAENSAAEYKLPTREISRIKYFEDLMIDRVNLLMDAGNLAKAFELLLVIQRRNKRIGRTDEWPGYVEANSRLIFEEAQVRVRANKYEQALAFYEDLWVLDPKHKGLSEGIGIVVDKLITDARAEDDLRKARFYLLRLNELNEDHPTVVKWVGDFIAETDKLIEQAIVARAAKRHDESFAIIKAATKVWPPHKRLKQLFQNAAKRFQVLNVGVVRYPDDKTPFFLPTPAQRRHRSLLAMDLFEVRAFDRSAYYQSRYFEDWNPTDLGREIVFTLRSRRKHWEANPLLDASSVVRSISNRLSPDSKFYDERLATFVDSMEVRSPNQFAVNFHTVPVRPQALFRFPVRKVASILDQTEAPVNADDESGDDLLADVLSQRFRIHKREDNKIAFRRVVAQPENLSYYNVAEIVEHKYASKEIALQSLLKGDISVLPDAPIWLADQIRADIRFRVETYGIPTTHVLQFNPESKPLKNPQFRRAIKYMTDRGRILKETILRDPEARRGRLTSAAFPTTSYAYANIDPVLRDLPLAFSLFTVAKQQFGGTVPELIMVCEPGETIRLAAEQLQIQWKRIGLNIKLVYQSDEATPENWDIVYRTVKMTEPVTELWPFLTMKRDARVEDLEHLPDWLRQQLVELEQAVDFKAAVEMLHRLHFRLDELVHVIPLWEIDDVIVFRRSVVQGTPDELISPYHGVEQWTIEPWFPAELQ